MKVIVTVVEQIISEAHIEIPDGLPEETIKQQILARYTTGQIQTEFNIFQVNFESISTQIVQEKLLNNSTLTQIKESQI